MLFKRKKKQSITAIGQIVDQPMNEFKKSLEEQHTNVGTMNNLIHYLNGAYADLRQRKDTIIKSLEREDITNKDRKEIEKTVKGIYSELIKIEEKVTYLQDRVKELIDVEGEIDSPTEQCYNVFTVNEDKLTKHTIFITFKEVSHYEKERTY